MPEVMENPTFHDWETKLVMELVCRPDNMCLPNPFNHGPVFLQLILQRVACQSYALLGGELRHGTGHPRLGVAKLVCLIRDHNIGSMPQLLEQAVLCLHGQEDMSLALWYA